MRRKYIISIFILLSLIIGIIAHKTNLINTPKLEKEQVDSSSLIKERIDELKQNQKEQIQKEKITTTDIETTIEITTEIDKETTIIEQTNNQNTQSKNNQQPNVEIPKNNNINNTEQENTFSDNNKELKEEPETPSEPITQPEPIVSKSIEEKLEELINKDFNQAVNNQEINKYEYPYQIDNTLKNKIETINKTKLDYSKNRFYIVNTQKLLPNDNLNNTYIYDKYTKHIIKIDNQTRRNTGTWFWCSNKNHIIHCAIKLCYLLYFYRRQHITQVTNLST